MNQEEEEEPNERPWPMPEAVTDGEWTIEDGYDAATSNALNIMRVPLNDGPVEHCLRAKQLGYAKWSPAEPNAKHLGLQPDVLDAVESARISQNLVANGVDMDAGVMDSMDIEIFAKRIMWGGPKPVQTHKIPFRPLMLSMLSAMGTGSFDRLYAKLSEISNAAGQESTARRGRWAVVEKALEMAHETNRTMWKETIECSCVPGSGCCNKQNQTLTWNHTERAARWLDLQLLLQQQQQQMRQQQRQQQRGKNPGQNNLMQMIGDPKSKANQERMKDDLRGFGYRPELGTHPNEWGEMEIFEPSRPHALPGRFMGRRRRPENMGVHIRNIHRFFSDKAIFSRLMKRLDGGTLLIDASGSMHLTPPKLVEIMLMIPAATIASYTKIRSGVGRLTLLAKKGRRVDEENIKSGGSNLIDGPALRWLAKQAKPRVWISDAHVVGLHGHTEDLVHECLKICLQAGIVRYEDLDTATEALRKARMLQKR